MRNILILVSLIIASSAFSQENITAGFKTGTDFGAYNVDSKALFVWAREDGSLGLSSVKVVASSLTKIYSTGVNQYTSVYPSISVHGNTAIAVYPDEEGKLRFLFYNILSDGSLKYVSKYVASEIVRVGISSVIYEDLLFVAMMGDHSEPYILCYEIDKDSVTLKTQQNIMNEKCQTIPRLAVLGDYLYITWIDGDGVVHLRAIEIKKQGGVSLIDKGERPLLLKTAMSNVKNVAPSDIVVKGDILYLSWLDSKDRYLHIRSYTPSGSSIGNYTDEVVLRERLSKYKILIVTGNLWVFWVGDGGEMSRVFSPSWFVYGRKM